MWKILLFLLTAYEGSLNMAAKQDPNRKDAYEYLKIALAQGHIKKAKRTIGVIRSKLSRTDDRYLYHLSLIHFLDGNYAQVDMDLANLDQFSSSPYHGKICHLAWLNALYHNSQKAIRNNLQKCQGILAKENNANLYWHTKVSNLKLDQLAKPWDSSNLESQMMHLIYRPIGGQQVSAQEKINHLRQWLKLKYYHQREKDVAQSLYQIPPFLFNDDEIQELMDVIGLKAGSEISTGKIAKLNSSLLDLSPQVLNGEWESVSEVLESLWQEYPYSFKINTSLALIYWLTGKTTEALFKIQHIQNTFPQIPTALSNLSGHVLMENGHTDEAKKVLYLAHKIESDHSHILQQNLWQWIGIKEQNHNLVFQASTIACDLGDKESCPLSYSYWRKTDELTGYPPSVD